MLAEFGRDLIPEASLAIRIVHLVLGQ